MKLKLKIQSYANQSVPSSTNTEYTFGLEGGSVGRSPNNAWTLEYDAHLSRQHMRIEIIGDKFYIRDLSSNGVFINNSPNSIGKNNTQQVFDGDIIRLGEHEVLTNIIDDSLNSDTPPIGNPSFFNSNPVFEDVPLKPEFNDISDGPISSLSYDDPFGDIFNPIKNKTNANIHQEHEEFNSVDNAFNPSPAVHNTESNNLFVENKGHNSHNLNDSRNQGIPAQPNNHDFINFSSAYDDENNVIEKSTPDFPLKPDAAITPHEETNSIQLPNITHKINDNSDDNSLEKLLSGAGITLEQIKKEVPQNIYEVTGKILQEAVQGVIELLRGRAEIKNHLKLDRTVIGDIENNPLKFMPNAEQVMIYLFTSGNGTDKSYLSLLDAMKEALDDLKAHQMAISISMHQALLATLRHHFSPDNLKKKLEKTNKLSSIIPLQREAKLWNMFESLYGEIEHEASENFQAILDKEIAKSYELQMMEIKYQRNINRKKKTS